MDESKPLEEIRNWEHPPWYGSDPFKETVTLIFLENQKGLFHHLTTHFRMPVKRLMIFGPWQETSHSAITLNQSQTLLAERRVPIPLKYIDVFKTHKNELGCQTWEKRIDGSRELSFSFFWRLPAENTSLEISCRNPVTKTLRRHKNLASFRTTFNGGTSSPVPTSRLPNKETAKTLDFRATTAPSAITSTPRPSNPRSRSRMNVYVPKLPPTSLHT